MLMKIRVVVGLGVVESVVESEGRAKRQISSVFTYLPN